jgi:hypothetical protein
MNTDIHRFNINNWRDEFQKSWHVAEPACVGAIFHFGQHQIEVSVGNIPFLFIHSASFQP